MRRLIIAVGTLAASAVALWSAYWIVAATFIQNRIELTLSGMKPEVAIKIKDAIVTGFPSTFEVDLTEVAILRGNGFRWSTSRAHVMAASLNPTRISIDLSHPHSIGGQWGEIKLTTTKAQVIALFGKTAQFPLQDLRFAFDDFELTQANGTGFKAEKIISVIKNRAGEDPGIYSVETEITGADISRLIVGLPQDYQRLSPIVASFDAFYTKGWDAEALRGTLPNFRGATLRQARVSFGNSELAVVGEVRLDSEGAITGNVKLTATNWREILQIVQYAEIINEDTKKIFTEILTDVEGLNGKPGTLELPLTIRNGSITYGIMTLGIIPPLR